MALYKYIPLNEKAKEIRLLTLLPDRFDAPIHITIQTKVLSAKKIPRFEALSYAWGSALDRHDIYVKPKPSKRAILRRMGYPRRSEITALPVTHNLFEAL